MNDFFSDNGHLFAILLGRYDLPEYAQDGDSSMDKAASLDDACFADEINRKFPMHTRAHTLISGAYLAKQASDDFSDCREIQHSLLKRAGSFNILPDYISIQKFVRSLEPKTAMPVEEVPAMAPFIVDIGLPHLNRIQGCGKQAVLKAQDVFLQNVHEMAPKMIKSAAQEILSAARSNGVETSLTTSKYAGIGSQSDDHIKTQKDLRLGFVTDLMKKGSAREELNSITTAEQLAEFDDMHNFRALYKRGLLEPPHLVFHSGETFEKKEASGPSPESENTWQILEAALGPERVSDLKKLGSQDLTEDEVKIVAQYL